MFRCINLWASSIILWISLQRSVKNDEFSYIIYAINRQSTDDVTIYRRKKHTIAIIWRRFVQVFQWALRTVAQYHYKILNAEFPKSIQQCWFNIFTFFGLVISMFTSASCFFSLSIVYFISFIVRKHVFSIVINTCPELHLIIYVCAKRHTNHTTTMLLLTKLKELVF